MTERVAIIDLGSNSARLLIMHIYPNGAYNLVYHQKESVRLSEGMAADNLLQPAAKARTLAAMRIFAHMCELFEVDKVIGVATAAVRNAYNGQELIEEIKQETRLPLQIISGEAEAGAGFIGVINTLDVTDGLIFDLGGASTEITLVRDRRACHVFSLPFGAVNLTERFGTEDKISEIQILKMLDYVQGQLRHIPWLQNIRLPLIGIGGTARNIAKMDQKRKNYPFPKVHNYRLGWLAAERLWEDLIGLNLAQRRKIAGLNNERADIIVAGVTIARCLFEATRSTQLIISGCGLREGLFLKHYLGKIKEPQIIPDILMHSTHNMLKFYNGNVRHAYKVAELAGQICDGWQSLLEFDGRNRVLLRVAALLHDIGITVNYYDHARHSAYLVENARLFGLTHREQMLTAVIAGWHNGPITKFFRRVYSQFLDEADWEIATKLSLVLALAESLDSTEMGLIKMLDAGVYNGQARLRLVTDDAAPVERQAVEKRRKWFKKVFGRELIII